MFVLRPVPLTTDNIAFPIREKNWRSGKQPRTCSRSWKGIRLCDDEKHRHLADLFNHDPKTQAGIFGSISAWMLGYRIGPGGRTMKQTRMPAGAVTPSTSDLLCFLGRKIRPPL